VAVITAEVEGSSSPLTVKINNLARAWARAMVGAWPLRDRGAQSLSEAPISEPISGTEYCVIT
jgi:hypothetical protein